MGNKKKKSTTSKKTTKAKPSDLGSGLAAAAGKQILTTKTRRNARLEQIMGKKRKPRKKR